MKNIPVLELLEWKENEKVSTPSDRITFPVPFGQNLLPSLTLAKTRLWNGWRECLGRVCVASGEALIRFDDLQSNLHGNLVSQECF